MKYKRRMLIHRLTVENLKMICFVTGITSVVIPVVFLCSFFMGSLTGRVMIFAVSAVLFEMFILIYGMLVKEFLRLLKQRESDNINWISRSFWAIFLLFCMILFTFNVGENINIVTYFIITAVISFLPISNLQEYAVMVSVQMIWMLILAYTKGILMESIVGIVLVNIICAIVSRMIYKNKIELYLLKNRLKNITKDALVDPLTGLLNRRGFEQQVKNIWPFCVRNEYKIALMIIDIDHFKQYNDEFGHPEGDLCLQRVAEEIRATAKRNTDITSRIGGEEFVVFIQGNKDEEILQFAERIRNNIEQLQIIHSPSIDNKYITVSIGLCISMPSEIEVGEMYEAADKELYLAKQSGRNAVAFSGCIKNQYSKLA